MNEQDDDDIKLQRASATLLSDLERRLPRLLRKQTHNLNNGRIHRIARERDLYEVCNLIQAFQEDPQLIDTHLKSCIPRLVSAYLESLQGKPKQRPRKGLLPLSHAICRILNLFCKVRGAKIIKGFLNNEPRYLEPILVELERGRNFDVDEGNELPSSVIPWTERYVLSLWLSHLLLAPFPLTSLSAVHSTSEASSKFGIELPRELPGVALRVITFCIQTLHSASKERDAAATLLVRLCVRPDMQKAGLLEKLVQWVIHFFSSIVSDNPPEIHQCLGILSYISALVSSTTVQEIGMYLPSIYRTCQNILGQDALAFVRASAVARKLIIKTLRTVLIHYLQAPLLSSGLDTTTVLEETIEILLDALADGDSPVRYAASKALSRITMKLDPEMASDVIEAVLGSFNENVYQQGSERSLSGVNPLQWHGLTLTLSHLLYHRAIPTVQLPDVLSAILLALSFEQRSANGGSVGTNVRDAACFGIWALSRRYVTGDLVNSTVASLRVSEDQIQLSVFQLVAIELLVVACLDPAGNIRRGSSAGLQELIGRHPNTVDEGIPLVQVVDFHAVGLRQKAMSEVAIQASMLHLAYWEELFRHLLGWRGVRSLDSASRICAARTIGELSAHKAPDTVRNMTDQICSAISALRSREVEERQGLVLSLTSILDTAEQLRQQSSISKRERGEPIHDFTHLWKLVENPELDLDDQAFISPALRPEFTASSICIFLGSMSAMSINGQEYSSSDRIPSKKIIRLLNLCLARHEDSVLKAIPQSSWNVLQLLAITSPNEKYGLISEWLTKLENEASYNGLRCSGHTMALGAVYAQLQENPDLQTRIVEVLTFRCTSGVAIDARIVALQAIQAMFKHHHQHSPGDALPDQFQSQLASALHVGLNDYTITDRGDIGSLVRVEALSTLGEASTTNLLGGATWNEELYADVLRLSLEKLDKVRNRAADTLRQLSRNDPSKPSSDGDDGVSSYSYFANALHLFKSSTSDKTQEAILLGYVSSASMGSESVVQNSRAALLDFLDTLPISMSVDEVASLSVQDIAECFLTLLKSTMEDDRKVVPLLDVVAYLFDMQIFQQLIQTSFKFRTLLSYTQKSHFKSSHMQKLQLALDVYRGLGTVPITRDDTIAKVTSMLLHPFPKIRIAAAEALWILTGEEDLKLQDWSMPSKALKEMVDKIKSKLQ